MKVYIKGRSKVKIIVDAMGGDNAPAEILKGICAARRFGVQLVAVGRVDEIQACAKAENLDLTGIELVNATEVIEMCDEPARAHPPQKGFQPGGGPADAGRGPGRRLCVRRLHRRAARGQQPDRAHHQRGQAPGPGQRHPRRQKSPTCSWTAAPTWECRPAMLEAFGVMGSVYMNKVMGVASPAVALVNNGAEETKGHPFV